MVRKRNFFDGMDFATRFTNLAKFQVIAKSSNCGIGLPYLPDEVWGKVFSFLPLVDRKSARLSCSRFYQISSGVALQQTDKMVFYGNLNTVEALQSFASSERRTWNLELNSVDLMDDSILPFFQRQGPKVRSLTLSNCLMAAGLFRSIIVHCENLSSLDVSFPSCFGPYANTRRMSREESTIIFSDFEDLGNAGTIRPMVTNFRCDLNKWLGACHPYRLTNKKFLDLFAIFPNIKKLELFLPPYFFFDETNPFSSDITSDTKFSFSCLYHQIRKMRHQLEKLTLLNIGSSFDQCPFLLTFNKISHIEMNKLKKLSLNYSTFLGLPSVMNSPQFELLTDFHCHIVRTYDGLPVIQPILHTAKQLRSLSVQVIHCNFSIEKNCFLALVKSRLEKLRFDDERGCTKINFKTSSLKNSLSPNNFLNCLDLKLCDSNILQIFIKYFPNLEILKVDQFEESLLETIFRYQIKLRNLILVNCKMSAAASLKRWLRSAFPLNRQLGNLTRLSIVESRSLRLAEILLNKFAFPRLESLFISSANSTCWTKNTVWRGILKCNKLKCLQIRSETCLSYSQRLVLCKNLPNLRYLVIFDPFDSTLRLSDSECRQLFQECPSLRVLFHGDYDFSPFAVEYFKNVIKNTVENVSKHQPHEFLRHLPPKYQYKNYWST